MNKHLTDITLVVDRSGSMAECKLEAQGGINAFIEEQKYIVGEAIFSLLQFDTSYDYVFNAVSMHEVKEYELIPRGMTALLDAIGKAIVETGMRLDKLPEDKKPGLVIIAIITDGEENSSSEFSKSQIAKMIKHQQDVYGWQFTFLGANQDAFHEAGGMGIHRDAIANYNTKNAQDTYGSLGDNVTRMRVASYSGQSIVNSYTDEERQKMIK